MYRYRKTLLSFSLYGSYLADCRYCRAMSNSLISHLGVHHSVLTAVSRSTTALYLNIAYLLESRLTLNALQKEKSVICFFVTVVRFDVLTVLHYTAFQKWTCQVSFQGNSAQWRNTTKVETTTYDRKLFEKFFILFQLESPTDEDESKTKTKSMMANGGHFTANIWATYIKVDVCFEEPRCWAE